MEGGIQGPQQYKSIKSEYGISTDKQNSIAKADAMDTLQQMLAGKYGSDGDISEADEQVISEQLEKYESQFKKGTGEVGLGKIIFGERFMGMATDRINDIISSGAVDKKTDDYVKDLKHEINDNLKQSGYKGGYSRVAFGAKMGQNINVLDRLPEDQKKNLTEMKGDKKAEADKILKKLGFDPDKRNYDEKTGAYEGSYMNEYGEQVRNFVKILENPETQQQYFVMTDIMQGDEESSYSTSTRVLGIQKSAEGLTLTEQVQAAPAKPGAAKPDGQDGMNPAQEKENLNKTLESPEFKNDKNRTKKLSDDQIKTFVQNGWTLADINKNLNGSLRLITGDSIIQLRNAIENAAK